MRILYFLILSVSICFASPLDQLRYPKEGIDPNCFNNPSGIIEQESIAKLNKLFAGFPAGKRVDSIKTTYGADTAVYKFTFNANGFVAQYISYKAGALLKRGEYEYNANGKVLSSATYEWNGSAWNFYAKSLYTYYDDNRVKTITSQSGSGSQWINSGRNTYTYYPSGLVSTLVYETWASDNWVNYTKQEWSYNQYNDITKRSYYSWKSSAWTLAAQDLYKYDVSRNNILKETYNYSGGEISYGTKDSMSYNAQNKITSLIKINLYYDTWKNNTRAIYDYDSKGNNITLQNDRWSDTAWKKSTITNSTFNSNNLVTEKTTRVWRDTVWLNSGRDTYSYNSAGKIVTNMFELFYENAWAKLYSAKYDFDASDSVLVRLHVDTWTVGNSSVGSWFTQINVDNNYLNNFDVSGYDINVYLTTVPIPVELAAFTATAKNGVIQLNWETSTETNNKGFYIERKASGSNWNVVGFVDGHGTSAFVNKYTYSENITSAGEYYYRLRQVDFDGTEKTTSQLNVWLCGSFDFALEQNYPNPFNPSTIISYSIPNESRVKLTVYSLNGQLVKELINNNLPAGNYNIKFDASRLSSGVYFYLLESSDLKGGNGNRLIRKMTLIK